MTSNQQISYSISDFNRPGKEYNISTVYERMIESPAQSTLAAASAALLDSGNYDPGLSSLNTSGQIGAMLNLMSGINVLPGNSIQQDNFTSNQSTIDLGRTKRFFNFWNNIKDPVELGQGFSKFESNTTTNFSDFKDRNVFVTYIVSLVFNELLSTPDGSNMTNPLDIFTERTDPFFCKATENLRQFLSAAQGLGNFPIFQGSNSPATKGIQDYVKENSNQGYLSSFCNNVYLKTCPNSKDPQKDVDNTTVAPEEDQKCIQDYRTKIARSEIALAWCGCFTPIPNWVRKIYSVKDPDTEKGKLTSAKFPNVCDNLCYGPPNDTIIKYYQPPFVANTADAVGNVIQCKVDVCVIDDNSINAVNSTGNINFNQICPKASAGTITECYLDVATPGILDNVKTDSGNGMLTQALFRQDCPDAVCYTIDDQTGQQNITKCNTINTPGTAGAFRNNINGLSGVQEYEKIYSGFWDGVIIIIFLLIFFELAYIEVHRYMQRSKLL